MSHFQKLPGYLVILTISRNYAKAQSDSREIIGALILINTR
jgi:hypothetical protein